MKPLAIAVVFATCSYAQLSFESASVKPSPQDDAGRGVDSDPGILRLQHQTLRGLVRIAYRLNDSQVAGGPKWAGDDEFNVIGKANGPANGLQLNQMLQSLLSERFKLTFHRESKTVSGFALVVAKGGVKMQASAGGDSTSHGGRGRIDAQGVSMAKLADRLTRLLRAPVEDATGTTGGFNFTLKWTQENASGASGDEGPTIFTALQEQLGLKLEARKVTMEVIVIDGAEKPGEN